MTIQWYYTISTRTCRKIEEKHTAHSEAVRGYVVVFTHIKNRSDLYPVPSFSYSRQRNEFSWSQANPKYGKKIYITIKRPRESPNTCEKKIIQVPKNNKFRKTRSRLGQENLKKEVEPIAPNSEAESQQNILHRNGIPIIKRFDIFSPITGGCSEGLEL